MNIGDIVTHENPFHVRGASTGAIEAITSQGWLQVWWQEDGDNQILRNFRSYYPEDLILAT